MELAYPDTFAENMTAIDLEMALRATRMESEGITLDLISRIMARVFDEAELRCIIRNLEATV